MSKKNNDPRFKTHIPEPRWQQIASLVLVLIALAIWLWLVLRH